MTKVAVTGIGIISSIGDNVQQTYESLISKRTGIGSIDILETKHRNEFKVGEIKYTNKQLQDIGNVDKNLVWTRTALLATIAAKQAIYDAGISSNKETALISATTVGGMDQSELHYKDMLADKHTEYIDTHHAGNSTEMVALSCEIGGIVTTISTACSSSLNSILFGARLIKNGLAKIVVAGGTDSLSKFTLNGFNTLMILDREHCRPFDATRTGLNLGEAAAYLVLEDYDNAIKEGKKVYAIVSGFANANDAHHQTASSDNGDGPYLSMKLALQEAGLEPSDIDYVNAHGTGTDNNDLTESIALKRLFEKVPSFSSTKAYTGHTLGAAGAVEAIISLLALEHKQAFPNINFKKKIEEVDISPESELINLSKCHHVLTNSFGFGGNDSSVIFSDHLHHKIHQQNIYGEKPVYITGLGCVSPQASLDGQITQFASLSETSARFEIQPPNYRDFIDPKQLRRMSKIVRMGLVSSSVALKNMGGNLPDAIVTGTGMGCQRDTEKFLNSMIENDEGLLTPTSFIQSTHNTIGGSIALAQKNHNYNLTYVHRTFSFESALLDSLLLIKEGRSSSVLVGGFDESTDESWMIKTKIGHYKPEPVLNNNIFNDQQKGAVAGEGSAFFTLSDKPGPNTFGKVKDVHTFLLNTDQHPENEILRFLKRNSIAVEELNLVLLGRNGDMEFDKVYDELSSTIFSGRNSINYKVLCGEYDTSTSFAMWLAASIINRNEIPEYFELPASKTEVNNVLIYNQFRNINHSLILLKR